jgi:hypothetical protein
LFRPEEPTDASKRHRGNRQLLALLRTVLFWMFHDRYLRLLDCFNELGRCFDPESETVAKDSNFVYGVIAALTLVLALLSAMIWLRLRNRRSSGA